MERGADAGDVVGVLMEVVAVLFEAGKPDDIAVPAWTEKEYAVDELNLNQVDEPHA